MSDMYKVSTKAIFRAASTCMMDGSYRFNAISRFLCVNGFAAEMGRRPVCESLLAGQFKIWIDLGFV